MFGICTIPLAVQFFQIICPGNSVIISCSDGAMFISAAYTGFSDKPVSSSAVYPIGSSALENTNCKADVGLVILNACNGRTSCNVAANYPIPDPCLGVYKYTVITYSCKI